MSVLETTLQLLRMRRDWNRRAKENARHYVVTHQDQWSDEEFFQSGQETLREEVLSDLGNICQGKDPKQMRVLEIGCGAGRVTRAFAGFFGEVFAVDISGEMVRQARQAVAGFPNAHVFRNNGKDLSVLRENNRNGSASDEAPLFDFAFSSLVFQHIPSKEIIESYVHDVHRLLKPKALFKFQVQGGQIDPANVDSWVGVSYTEEQARALAALCGFEMRHHHGAGEQYYVLWFFKR